MPSEGEEATIYVAEEAAAVNNVDTTSVRMSASNPVAKISQLDKSSKVEIGGELL